MKNEIINENKIIENIEEKEKNDEEIYSEVYGINEGNIFERVSPTKPKNKEIKKSEIKIEPKKLEKVTRDNKKRGTWAPTHFKNKLGDIKYTANDKKKNLKESTGTNRVNKIRYEKRSKKCTKRDERINRKNDRNSKSVRS